MTKQDLIACLPMYDWPEVRPATDALWAAMAAAFARHGIDAPTELDRETPREDAWAAPTLVLGQTCGLPYMRSLRGRATLLGSPIYDLPDAEPGDYYSVIVARVDDPAATLADFRGRRVAYNGADSQSGYAALQVVVAPLAEDGQFFGTGLTTGTHRRSAAAVAEGRADIAALDAVSWQLLSDHDAVAGGLKIIATTPLSPGLPYITSLSGASRQATLNTALAEAINDLDPASRRALRIEGFRPRAERDYAILPERLAAAEKSGYPALS
jgi:ABC-type phosphate/phosphonate transport system substrate-binding protein